MKIYDFLCLLTGRPWGFPHLFVTRHGKSPSSSTQIHSSESARLGILAVLMDPSMARWMSFGASSMTSETSMTGTSKNHVEQKKTGEKKHVFEIYIYIYIYIWTKMENISINIHRIWKTSLGSSPFEMRPLSWRFGWPQASCIGLAGASWSSRSITSLWKSLEDVGNIPSGYVIYSDFIVIL